VGAELDHIKAQIRRDTARMIEQGEPVGGQILPKHPWRIDVVGKGKNNLQVRVFYKNQAPYYFDMIPE
jgi:hypothetical protein